MSARADTTVDAANREFFESKIRPILVESCFDCHSGAARPVQSGLRLDSRAALLQGGSRGAALAVGSPEKSLLIRALRGEGAPAMPPKGRLAQEKIALLEEWVKRGAPFPEAKSPSAPAAKAPFNLKERAAKHWSWQAIRPQAAPSVKNRAWIRNPIDSFILAKLEASGLAPAPSADRRTLIRRVTFDLIGLPPTPSEVDAFVNDRAPDAYEKVVDRLLASPHYGERWGRHWLDLMRYAETYGHEGDYDKPGAYHYRDYVIRAFNADVPYNRFVMEHVAGDLLPAPRKHPQQGFNESILATGFWWLGEGTHSPVDILQDESDRIDNQIDVFGKAFLGLSIGCARCHDHKFDAISTKDYYALGGIIRSSRYQLTAIDCPERRQAEIARLEALNRERDTLLAGVNPAPAPHIRLPEGAVDFADFTPRTYAGWSAFGQAFGKGPEQSVTRVVASPSGARLERISETSVVDSGALSNHLQGVLRSPTFTITKPRIFYHLAGSGCEVRLILHGLQLIQDPIYGGLKFSPNSEKLQWYGQDVSKWIGRRAYIELSDTGSGRILADRILFSDSGPLPDEHVASGNTGALTPDLSAKLSAIEAQRAQIAFDDAPRAPAMADGTGENDRVHIRGSYKSLGDEVPRRFLEACGGTRAPAPASGSGRLALATRMTAPDQTPLVPRVIVNRIWQHHFGEGIVRSPDDFGFMGQAPTHPELLDWLAAAFVRSEPQGNGGRSAAGGSIALGWSLKRLHRLMVLSSAYRMDSRLVVRAEQADPQNRLLHRMPIRRLEAEAIRDAVLAVSGRLDSKLYGPSVMPYLSPFMEGRGRPGSSGPLDGDGRRSIYLGVRRNFLPLFFLAFDYPVPFTCIGRRSVSNVPAQALAMMNNPFILQQSEVWAKRVLANSGTTPEQRIDEMYRAAFGRPATAQETADAKAFVMQQPGRSESPETWADLCHALFNAKEFIFVN